MEPTEIGIVDLCEGVETTVAGVVLVESAAGEVCGGWLLIVVIEVVVVVGQGVVGVSVVGIGRRVITGSRARCRTARYPIIVPITQPIIAHQRPRRRMDRVIRRRRSRREGSRRVGG